MKYYIKTLRSNLDNILSSESISPYSYYQNRGYGYQRFDRLKDEHDEHSLRIDTKILEDGEDVIYIEIDKDDPQLAGVECYKNCESFFLDKPFYLYPWNSRILFKSIEDAQNSVFICRSSLANKMWNYFPTGIADKGEHQAKNKSKSEKSINHNNDIEVDIRRDRLKGYLFAYYWGCCKSLSAELARLLQAELRIYGLATVLAGMRYPSDKMLKEIDRQKKIFNQFDPNRALLKKRWEEVVLNGFSTEADKLLFDSLIDRLGVKKQAMDAFAAEQGVVVSPRLEITNMAGMNWKQFGSQIESYTQSQINQCVENKQIRADQRVTIGSGGCVLSSNDSLYVRLLNEIVKGCNWLSLEKITTRKLEVASELALYVKAYYENGGYTWEGSAEQAYLDSLRRNIANSEPFDPNQISNLELRALAVFVLKGDLMDEMLKYMQVAAVEDYSLVFGLWGASVGYAGIPKTFMQKAQLPQQKVNVCYDYTYTSLTGLENSASLNPNSYTDGMRHQAEKATTPNKILGYRSVLCQMSQPPLKLSAEQIAIIDDILQRNNGRIDEQGFKQIGQIKGIGKRKLALLRQILKPYTVELTATLFKDESEERPQREFSPKEVVKIVTECLPDDDKVREQVEKDVLWYLNGGNGPKEKLIPGLCDYLQRNKYSYGKRQWVRKLYVNVDVELIERKLREAYL